MRASAPAVSLNFNPRSREGSDFPHGDFRLNAMAFQSTLP